MKNTRVADSTALAVRACARGLGAWAGYTGLFLAGGSATALRVLRNPAFLRDCLRAELSTLRPATPTGHPRVLQVAGFNARNPIRSVVDRTLVRLSRESVGYLFDDRVRRLQARIVRLTLERDCGIRPDSDETEELSHLDSVRWIRESLLIAAGLPLARVGTQHQGGGQYHPNTARCRVVFPAFLHTLRMHRGWTSSATSEAAPTSPAPALPRTRVFPEELARRERAVVREYSGQQLEERYRMARLRRPEAALAIYFSAIGLLTQAHTLHRRTAQRLLRRITRYHGRRTSWTHGQAAFKAQTANTAALNATPQRI